MRRSILGCKSFGSAAMMALAACWQSSAVSRASISASATLTSQQLGPNSFEYSLTLHNTGTTNISTFWFAWQPFYDFLPTDPSSAPAPANWTGNPIQDGFYGGFSVEWTTTTSALAAGGTLSGFKFDTSDPPSVIEGISPEFPFNVPVETSWVYIGASQAPGDPGSEFTTTTVVPEPTIALLAPAALLLRRRRAVGSER